MSSVMRRLGVLLLSLLLLSAAWAGADAFPSPTLAAEAQDVDGVVQDPAGEEEAGVTWYLEGLILCGAVVFMEWRKRRIVQ